MAGVGSNPISVNQAKQAPLTDVERQLRYKAKHPQRYQEKHLANEYRYQAAHPDRVRSRKRNWRQRIGEQFFELRNYLWCEECGSDRSLVFHHRDPEFKSFDVGTRGRSWSRMLEEIDKCDVLCRTCHAFAHDLMGVL